MKGVLHMTVMMASLNNLEKTKFRWNMKVWQKKVTTFSIKRPKFERHEMDSQRYERGHKEIMRPIFFHAEKDR